MNRQPIDDAHDPDLRHSLTAMLRAARRARELARQTGTSIVISRNGVLETIPMPAEAASPVLAVQEPPAPYGGRS